MRGRVARGLIAGAIGLGFAAPMGATAQETVAPARGSDVATIPVAVEATADAPPATEEKKAAQIEQIIVTARRTEESQQDVPIAITAFDDKALERESIGTVQDLQGRIPSLVMGTNGQQRSTESPTIRGQGATYGGGSGVLLYFAEAPLPSDTTLNNVGGPGKFFDLQNIQVLKGSQGTLFGRNTTGGALLLQPHKPENYTEGSLTAEGSNFSGQGYEGVFNTPIIADTLLFRAGAKYVDRDGFTHDVTSGKDYDDKHWWTARAGLTWLPTEGVEDYLLVYYSKNADNGTSVVMRDANPAAVNGLILSQIGVDPLPLVPPEQQPGCIAWDTALAREASRCGQLFADEQNARDHRHVEFSGASEDNLKTGGVVNALTVDLSDELALRNINSYSFLKHQYAWDFDGSRSEWTDFANPPGVNQADFDVYSEELQLQGKYRDGRLVFAAGAYYERQRPQGPESEVIRALYNDIRLDFALKRDSYGPFAQATYDLGDVVDSLDGLRITAGARYSKDDLDGKSVFAQSAFGIPSAPVESNGVSHDSAVTWTIGADYKMESALLYGKISRGYKTGGFAITAVNPRYLTYKPEFVLNYEIGHKIDFAIGGAPVRINSAVYYTDYTDMQRNAVDVYSDSGSGSVAPRIGAAVYNAGKASIAGLELEATILPFDGMTLSANYAYTHGKYEKYTLTSAQATGHLSCTGERVPIGETVDLACMPFQFTPKHQYSLTALYRLPVSDSLGTVSGSVTWAWTAKTYTSATTLPDAEPGAWLNPIGLLNANLSWDGIAGSSFYAQIFGTNLLDKDYRMGNQNVWNTLGFTAAIYGEPRIVGMRLGYRWGG